MVFFYFSRIRWQEVVRPLLQEEDRLVQQVGEIVQKLSPAQLLGPELQRKHRKCDYDQVEARQLEPAIQLCQAERVQIIEQLQGKNYFIRIQRLMEHSLGIYIERYGP